ncbi:hypothetical protein UU9_12543 [Rhodanobacter fulvus Jip2]|uniref:Uncharacterized protein n=1 Tax=Rhodanobacter fulvus Jip2 TaxID=1163408 RepID=I4VMY7_9GAMM|nr:hypothetical protein [Rhodanobacter fulvus]EIL88578.1 hypothetical protein UU9_12543 [Rhodanobacter fulvus Jip2]
MTQKFTAEEVRETSRLIRDHAPNEYAIELDCSRMLEAYADTLSKPADSGRVGDVEAAYRYIAPSWQEISAAEGDAIAALKVLHHAGSLINAQLPGTAQLCAKWPSLIGTIKAALAAQGQGEAVAKVRHFDYRGIARNGFSQEAQMLDGAPVLPDGTPLYTRPAPASSPAGVPDVLIHKALTIAANIRTADWLDAGGTLNEQDALADYLAAAPSAPEGDMPERCEGGSPECGPVEHHDSEGVPLCATCWDALLADSNATPEGDGGEG